MTKDDVKEFTDVEIAIIAVVKVGFKKQWNLGEIWKECSSNPVLKLKFIEAFQGCTDIFEELKTMTVGKWIEIVKVAVSEVASESVSSLGNG
jgi:hypothetical protein